MEKVDKEILEYLTKNIPNFQYTKFFAQIICKHLNDSLMLLTSYQLNAISL